MSWEISIINNFNNSNETCLQLVHSEKNKSFRSWYGPLAKHIHQRIQAILINEDDTQLLNIEKQFAQYLLMQASFIHQRCLFLYRVTHDLELNNLKNKHALAEFLLFIRMTTQHPSHQTLLECAQTQMPWCDEPESAIDLLIESKLIQRIDCKTHAFYDKNPYPHDHVLDLLEFRLNDFDIAKELKKNEKLVLSAIN